MKTSRENYRLIKQVGHDPGAFTQGLCAADGLLYESTGLYGSSSLRQLDPATGEILRRRHLPKEHFGEGIAVLDNRLYHLTWHSGFGFIYQLPGLGHFGRFPLEGKGWGLTSDGEQLLMSNGSSIIVWLHPKTFKVTRQLRVTRRGVEVTLLNDLQYLNGELFANIFPSRFIARICLGSGEVIGLYNFAALYRNFCRYKENGCCLNGIAHKENNIFYLTGKLFPALFEVEFTL